MQRPVLLLVGHGTRAPAGQAQFLKTVSAVQRRLPRVQVTHAWLEQHAPDVVSRLHELALSGTRQTVIVPLLLFAAGHWHRDLPALVQTARQSYPELSVRVAPPLVPHPAITRMFANRIVRAVAERGWAENDTQLLVVGRGSGRPAVRRSTQVMAEQIAASCGWTSVATAFLRRDHPTVAEKIRVHAHDQTQRVVCCPLLVYRGELLRRLQRIIIVKQELRSGRQQFLLAGPTDDELEPVVVVTERYAAECRDFAGD